MDKEIASFIWYLGFMLVPIIPAIIIYKMFPATKVGANGMLGSLKINATGAFAGYLVTAMLGFLYVQFKDGKDVNAINDGYETWEVSTKLQFKDKNGRPVSAGLADSMTRKTSVSLHPGNIIYKQNGIVRFMVTGKKLEDIIVNFSFDQFGAQTIALGEIADSNLNVDKRTINLGTINMNEEALYYMATMDTTASAVKVVPIGNANDGPPLLNR